MPQVENPWHTHINLSTVSRDAHLEHESREPSVHDKECPGPVSTIEDPLLTYLHFPRIVHDALNLQCFTIKHQHDAHVCVNKAYISLMESPLTR